MKKQNVFLGSLLSGDIRIPCLMFLLLLLSACGSGGSADNGSSNNSSGLDSNGSSSVSAGANRDAGLGNGSATLMATRDILWKTDGTSAGTVQVPISSLRANVSYAYAFTEFNGAYYFQANDGVSGFELWKTDGTPAGTVMVKDINADAASSFHYRFNNFTVFNGALYFEADDGVHGYELWKTDGTAAGTVLVKDINSGSSDPNDFTVFNGALYFRANDTAGNGQLWKTDGSAAGTVLVKDGIATGTSFLPDDFARGFSIFNGVLYFSGPGGFWKTDGTPVGTVLAEDFNTAAGWLVTNLYNGFIVFNSALYIPADDGVNGKEMWRTDGTTAGTSLLKDINTENGGRRSDYFFNEFTVFNGALYFQAKDNVNGYRLWKTDGSAAGTVLLKALSYVPASGFQVFNGALYFTLGSSLWKTDGTAAGTVLVSAS